MPIFLGRFLQIVAEWPHSGASQFNCCLLFQLSLMVIRHSVAPPLCIAAGRESLNGMSSECVAHQCLPNRTVALFVDGASQTEYKRYYHEHRRSSRQL